MIKVNVKQLTLYLLLAFDLLAELTLIVFYEFKAR